LFNVGCINCWFPIAWKPYLLDIWVPVYFFTYRRIAVF
jgi:hypothetical protein